MLEYRITKYDPDLRDEDGQYIRNEWVEITDIGRRFDAGVLTREEYERVENAYVTTAKAFLSEAGVEFLKVDALEFYPDPPFPLAEGEVLSLEKAGEVLRHMLRNKFWCRLETPGGFIHADWNLYMYVGVPEPVFQAHQLARDLGLFVEPFESPKKDKPEDDEDEEEETEEG